MPQRNERPAIVTTIGVCSIVVASLTFVGLLVTGVISLSHSFISSMGANNANSMNASNAFVAQPLIDLPTAADIAGTRSQAVADRTAVRARILESIDRLFHLRTDQRRQLDWLLARYAESIFSPAFLLNTYPTTQDVTDEISASRLLSPMEARESEGIELTLSGGRGSIALRTHQAEFTPPDGPKLVSDKSPSNAEEASVASMAALPPLPMTRPASVYKSGLSDKDIDSILAQIDKLAGTPISPAERSGVSDVLKDGWGPEQSFLIQQGSVATSVVSVARQFDQSLIIYFPNGRIDVDLNGKAAAQSYGRREIVRLSPMAATLNLVGNVLSAALAIYLLTVGILTHRNSRFGGLYHWFYALMEVPIAVLAIATAQWWSQDMAHSEVLGSFGSGSARVQLVIAVLSLLYPATLMVLLNLPDVRSYYRYLNS